MEQKHSERHNHALKAWIIVTSNHESIMEPKSWNHKHGSGEVPSQITALI